MKFRSFLRARQKELPTVVVLVVAGVLCLVLLSSSAMPLIEGTGSNQIASSSSIVSPAAHYYSGYSYNPSAAVNYGEMVHKDYYHAEKYPAGINQSIMQDNMDYFSSEDCAHFVSEALIAGGLTALASNPPGDNLAHYLKGFPGSYGIVGVYRFVDYLAGYDLPVFPTNSTIESLMGYQPIPGSYTGSPHASIYYVENESILPQYILSPGDVIADGGVGNGHAMLYIGNGQVVQTDPAQIWTYFPGTDYNISFYGKLTLQGKNVSALYVHMPTISSQKTVKITALSGNTVLNKSRVTISKASQVTLVASYPDGVGFGNYTFRWSLNGNYIGSTQVTKTMLNNGQNNIELQASGSNGTAYYNMTINVGSTGFSILGMGQTLSVIIVAVPVAAVIVGGSYILTRKRKN